MAGNAIHFGTSGWRGVIGDDFTFDGIRTAAAAIAAHVRGRSKHPVLLVGHDTRFFSEIFAREAAEILEERGCRVLFCPDATPTPVIAFGILHRKAQGAVNITASHNPAAYNGLKFSGPDGGPALPEVTRDIESRAKALGDRFLTSSERLSGREFESADLRENYFRRLGELVRFDVIATSKSSLAFDALHGCGAGWLDRVLNDHGISVNSIRTERDVLFDGSGPDPSEENLAPLKRLVQEKKSAAGLATDGDADRFGILDRDGSFVAPNHILALLFDYLVETRCWTLGVARSVATTHLLDAVARHHGVPVYETPVGFKYIGPYLERDQIALGGEESAGMTIRGHVPEKDGILACLLLAEMVAARRAPLAQQLRNLFRRVGRECWPVRVNLHVDQEIASSLPRLLAKPPLKLDGKSVARASHADGLKMIFADDSWVLLRPSGTEPLVRIYAEAETLATSKRLADEARKWIMQ